jgi:hypothetical protein
MINASDINIQCLKSARTTQKQLHFLLKQRETVDMISYYINVLLTASQSIDPAHELSDVHSAVERGWPFFAASETTRRRRDCRNWYSPLELNRASRS